MHERTRLPAVCQTCGHQGVMPARSEDMPAWCACDRSGKGGGPGPFQAPAGAAVRFTFETKGDAAFRERCQMAGNAQYHARNDFQMAWYTPSGRRRPASSARVRAARKAYRAALRALEACQAECPHPSRSPYSAVHCDVCYAYVECNVADFRHLVRVAGKRFAMRVAI